MNKQEFEQRIGKEISTPDYEAIEKVYTWHPAIRNVDGKEQITAIYQAGGMLVIKNMLETAKAMEKLDDERRKLQEQMMKLDDRTNWVRNGNLNYEKCLEEVEEAFTKSDDYDGFMKTLQTTGIRYGESVLNRILKDNKYY